MSKLTLSIDAEVVARAKRYAKVKNTSVLRVVQQYLARICATEQQSAATPILDQLRGTMKRAGRADYLRHLEAKYFDPALRRQCDSSTSR